MTILKEVHDPVLQLIQHQIFAMPITARLLLVSNWVLRVLNLLDIFRILLKCFKWDKFGHALVGTAAAAQEKHCQHLYCDTCK